MKALYIDIVEPCSRFPLQPCDKIFFVAKVLSKCKNLETLDFGRGMHVDKTIASAIATSLPKLKYLVLKEAKFYKREYLVMILQGCKEIVHMDVRNCIGFYYFDTEILNLASHIPVFMCEGCSIQG